MTENHPRFGIKDAFEMAIGAIVLAFPIALTEEVWTISMELSLGRLLWIMASSIVFIGFFCYYYYYQNRLRGHWREFLSRVFVIYGLTLGITAMILASIDKLEFDVDPIIGIKRIIIVALPACFAATVVDSLS